MKKLSLLFLIVFLVVPCSTTHAQNDPITAATEQTSTDDQPQSWFDWTMGKLVQVIMGGIPPEAITNDATVKHYEKQLEDIHENLKVCGLNREKCVNELQKNNNCMISQKAWENYFLKTLKTSQSLEATSNTNESAKVAAYLKAIIELHTKETATKTEEWLNKASMYADLQQQLNSAQPSHYVKPALRCLGYTGVFLLGPYLGNGIYTQFLHHYFSDIDNRHDEIMQRIVALEEQCHTTTTSLELAEKNLKNARAAADTHAESKLKATIKRLECALTTMFQEIETLTAQMSTPQQAAAWRIYAGIGVRVSMIALTTYLFYTMFKKVDENYLIQHPLSEQATAELKEQITLLTVLKDTYSAQEATLQELEKIRAAVNNNNYQATYNVGHLYSVFKDIVKLQNALIETEKNIEIAKAHAAAQFLPK